ncbi:MAG: iron complex transport system ATP-binding protein [Frankiaceae bacterium]|jgi:iron complex transport system ATP-binding protein|nr:iron complex transport system ATP-binding protein [Frankiaceae bacterium]
MLVGVTAAVELPHADGARSSGSVVFLSDVSVRRGGALLLRNVTWTVRPEERWVVLGANGAGKTTLLQVAAGNMRPTRGDVELLGEPLDDTDLDDLLPRIGWASAALADRLPADETVLDIVLTASYATVRRGAERYDAVDESRAQDLLAQLGCRALVDRAFGTLSEGERKRVQLARALMTDPEILLLDEPAAGLDLGAREALLRTLSRLAADPAAPTLVLVSHHVEEVPAGFTHALLLRAGEIVAAGPLAEVMRSAALSACFGLPLRLHRHGDRYTARAALLRLP